VRIESISSFFDEFILNPLSKELSLKERVAYLVASVAIGIFTLGTVHAVCFIRKRQFSASITKESLKKSAELAQRVALSTLSLTAENSCLPEKITTIIQEKVIAPFYAKKLPHANEVTVPYKGQRRRWKALTQEEKVEAHNAGTLPHNQHPQSWIGRRTIDRRFMPEGQSPFLPNDPRKSHGSDHAARTSVIASLFYYLYHKYHPTYGEQELDTQTLHLIQLTGAAHDSKRQTEGADVYDADSADALHDVLEELGVEDVSVLKECSEAIEQKDSDPLQEKSLIARCLQNADSVEFSRLSLSSPVQHKVGFDRSLGYLDIYKEFCHLKKTEQVTPQHFEEFETELKAIRLELNRLIYATHKKRFRSHASRAGANYCNEILATVNKSDFPLLSAILTSLGTKKELPPIRPVPTSYIISWLKTGLDLIPTSLLLEFQERLQQDFPDDSGAIDQKQKIADELKRRGDAEKVFEAAFRRRKKDLKRIAKSFANLPHISKEKYRPTLHNFIKGKKLSSLPPSRAKTILITEQKYVTLSHLLQKSPFSGYREGPLRKISRLFAKIFGNNFPVYKDPRITHAENLVHAAQGLLEDDASHHDCSINTALAKAFEYAAAIFTQQEEYDKANDILNRAKMLPIADIHPLITLLNSHNLSTPFYISTGCDSIRKRRLRVCEKHFQGKGPCIELSFELTTKARTQLKQAKPLFQQQSRAIATGFQKRTGDLFSGQQPEFLGNDYEIKVNDSVTILVGKSPVYMNPHRLVRIRFKRGTPIKQVHDALSTIGLPTALMVSRSEDELKENLSRLLTFYYPKKMVLGDPNKSPHTLYANLSSKERKRVDRDLASMKPTLVGPDQLEWTLPSLPNEARGKGGRVLGTFIDSDSIENTSHILSSVLQTGLLSSQERLQRGIFGQGCNPSVNLKSGSGNQVFTRFFTENQFSSRENLENFVLCGKIFLVLDLQAFERIPYFYLEDRAGLRNPRHRRIAHFARWQWPVFPYRPRAEIKRRPSFEDFLSSQTRTAYPLNEVMFDQTLSPHYIRKIIVESEKEKAFVLATLKHQGISTVNGTGLDQMIETSKVLDPTIV